MAVSNVLGSNVFNIFLGLGLPWAVSALYWDRYGAAHESEWRARCELQVTRYTLRATRYTLHATSYKLHVTSCKLQVTSYK